MKLICPSCGAVHSAESWTNDADARQCLRIVAEMPAEIGRRVLPYLALFRSDSGRGLKWSKALRLLSTLVEMTGADHIQWDRSPARPNSVTAWAMALEQIIQRPPRRLPLASHGYLKKIAYDLADSEDRAAEVKRNAAERSGNVRKPAARKTGGDDGGWRPGPDDFKKLKDAAKGIGERI